jgi:hypothetical protein
LKEKPDRKLYHVTSPLLQTSLVQVVAYPFSWFTKFHDFMLLTGTTKIGIHQIKLSLTKTGVELRCSGKARRV